MSMNKTCAISNWISFLISVDIQHGEKEVAQRENHRWTAERRAQLEFCIATGPREEHFPDSFFTIASDLNRLSLPMILVSVDAHSAPGGVCIAQLVLRKWRNEVLLEKW